ncbi:hypothetical protein TEK04_16825 [Klenkia sp. LSe6-5]|uniref:Uncharacterized protein n=1 Tax=Klenkia sesuvii TaxID=3103137 RepID=A0ABU8DX23_9ACTN
MDRPADTVSTRVLLWGVVAPLLLGSFVPPLSALATLWLLIGLGTLVVQAVGALVRRADPGEDDVSTDLDDDLHEQLRAALPVPTAPGRWWNRPLEDPNTAAARAGSWG